MNKAEVARLLAVAAAFDQRTTGEEDDIAWLAAVGDLNFNEAREAVISHYRESTNRLMPAHIRQRVEAVRVRRLAETKIPAPPPELLDNPQAYSAALRAAAVAIADGRDPEAAQKAVAQQVRRELEAS